MNQSYPGGPGGEYRPQPGRGRQPDQGPDDDWFRPQRGQERESDRGDAAAEYDGRRHLPARRPLNLPASRPLNLPVDRPRFSPFLRVTSVDLMALTVHEGRKPGRNWALIAGTVFFLADTILMANAFTRPVATMARVLVIFIWLISVAAAVLLWLRGSTGFSSLFNRGSLARVSRARSGSHARHGNGRAR